jgi:hypothetical protein
MVDMAAFRAGGIYVHDLYADAKFRWDKSSGKAFVRFYGQKESELSDAGEMYRDAISKGNLITREEYDRDG